MNLIGYGYNYVCGNYHYGHNITKYYTDVTIFNATIICYDIDFDNSPNNIFEQTPRNPNVWYPKIYCLLY